MAITVESNKCELIQTGEMPFPIPGLPEPLEGVKRSLAIFRTTTRLKVHGEAKSSVAFTAVSVCDSGIGPYASAYSWKPSGETRGGAPEVLCEGAWGSQDAALLPEMIEWISGEMTALSAEI